MNFFIYHDIMNSRVRKKYNTFMDLSIDVFEKLNIEIQNMVSYINNNKEIYNIYFTDKSKFVEVQQINKVSCKCLKLSNINENLMKICVSHGENNFDDLCVDYNMLQSISDRLKNIYDVKMTDYLNVLNWKTICNKINNYINEQREFNILRIRDSDDVGCIFQALFKYVNQEYYKHIGLFLSFIPNNNVTIDETKLFSTYVANSIDKNTIITYKHLFESICEFEKIIIYYNTTKNDNKHELLRSFNHVVFDTYNLMINSNELFNISNMKTSKEYTNSLIINKTVLKICENIRNYIYNHCDKLTKQTQMLFDASPYKSVKCPLKQIIKNNDDFNKINKTVFEVNDIVERVCYFIKLFVLNHYEHSDEMLDFINEGFISMSFKAITETSNKGSKLTGDNEQILAKLVKFHDEHFNKIYPDKLSAVCYSQILNSSKTHLLTAYTNNVSMNYFKLLEKYVRITLKISSNIEYSKLKKEERKEFTKQLNRQIRLIVKDITESKVYESDSKYHDWINENKPFLVPSVIDGDLRYDVSNNPNKYFKYMLKINKLFEKHNFKVFNCFPMSDCNVPSNIEIDTVTLIGLFQKQNKETDKFPTGPFCRKHLRCMNTKVWMNLFKLNNQVFKYKNYLFNNMIQTDGYSVTVLFSNKDLHGVTVKKGKTVDEFEYIDNLGLIETIDSVKSEEHIEQEQLKLKDGVNKLKQDYNLVYVDAGINPDIIYCCNDDSKNRKYYKHTRKQRTHQTGRLTFQIRRNKQKSKNKEVSKIEKDLKQFSVKTCIYSKFIESLKARIQNNLVLKTYYRQDVFRKMRFWQHINTKRSESNVVKNIKTTFEKDNKKLLLVYGNWNRSCHMKGTLSVPMIGFKRMLNKEFKVLNFDEFRTSCMSHETNSRCVNANVMVVSKKKDKLGVVKETSREKSLHSVLVSEIRNLEGKTNLKRYQNRNRHAVENFKLIVDGYANDGKRLPLFSRANKETINKTFEIKIATLPDVKPKDLTQVTMGDPVVISINISTKTKHPV